MKWFNCLASPSLDPPSSGLLKSHRAASWRSRFLSSVERNLDKGFMFVAKWWWMFTVLILNHIDIHNNYIINHNNMLVHVDTFWSGDVFVAKWEMLNAAKRGFCNATNINGSLWSCEPRQLCKGHVVTWQPPLQQTFQQVAHMGTHGHTCVLRLLT